MKNNSKKYASTYDFAVLGIETIEGDLPGSAKPLTDESASMQRPDKSPVIRIADLLNLVKGDAAKYIPDYQSSDIRYSREMDTQKALGGKFRLYYLDMKKATALLQGAKVLMPKMPATHDGGFIRSLSEQGSPVKGKSGSVTESQQFRRWFGDWQNDPETASKVVNNDGTPKVVYHGTNKAFWQFDLTKTGSNYDCLPKFQRAGSFLL